MLSKNANPQRAKTAIVRVLDVFLRPLMVCAACPATLTEARHPVRIACRFLNPDYKFDNMDELEACISTTKFFDTPLGMSEITA